MKQKYKVISGKQDISHLIHQLHTEELLAIGIMDTGTKENLQDSIAWYCSNFNHGIHVISQEERFNWDDMKAQYPDVTFIIFQKTPSLAERINAFASETDTTYFYLTRSDVETVAFEWDMITTKMKRPDHPAVLTPLVFNRSQELTPTVRAPHMNKNDVDPLSFIPSTSDDQNLYPFLGLGLYDRALFQRLRGYDTEIKGAYWQALDFGTRCWLYGHPIYSVNYLAIIFPTKQFLIEDRSECDGIERFYTKAFAVQVSNGKIKIRKPYKNDKSCLENEVRPRAALYRIDFATLCAFWKAPEESK